MTSVPKAPDAATTVETVIVPRARDIGGFEVRRALPAPGRRMVGPFIFFDQMGPAEFLTGQGIDVRPHPHVGLATVTYLFRGEVLHRDSLGTKQVIHPGAVNWMVAGRGITHSERTAPEVRERPHELFGIQTWVALPEAHEDEAPSFSHHARHDLPELADGGATMRLILGHAYGERAPAIVFSDTFYVDLALSPGASAPLPDDHEDRGLYVVEGEVVVAGDRFEAGRMLVFRPGDRITLVGGEHGCRLIALGGATLGPRFIWWNFVASSSERIEAAKDAWRKANWGKGRFDLPPDDHDEFIPAPEK
jgi:redox-sensitive bicupin YhaK (pirin superfamily)